MVLTPKNARGRPVTKLCLALEAFRRTEEGRIRDAKAFLGHYFPHDKSSSTDRIFLHMPKEVRADLLSNWGIRGKKSALRDNDEKVRATVTDSLAAGDIDAAIVEESVTPEILIDWVPLDDWWTFWRGSNVPIDSVRKALATARDLSLFDERWFLDHLKLGSQKLQGTDVICAALSKEQIAAWLHSVHTRADASPSGLVGALGWETILAKTAHEALTFALDALAGQIGLAEASTLDASADAAKATSRPPPPRSPSKPPSAGPEQVATRSAPQPTKTVPPAASSPNASPVVTAARETPSSPPAASTRPSFHPAPSTRPSSPPAPSTRPSSPPSSRPRPSSPPMVSVPRARPSSPPIVSVPRATPSSPPAAAMETATPKLPPVVEAAKPAPATQPAASNQPNARHLFGAPAVHDLPPMRRPAATLSGVGGPEPHYDGHAHGTLGSVTAEVAVPTFTVPPDDPNCAPPQAEPGDMGWDLVHGVKRSLATNIAPKYHFEDDEEPTGEIAALQGENRRPR
jgi:hypothetical protein